MESSSCLRRQQLIDREPCLLGDALQEMHRRHVMAVDDVADGGLADSNAPREHCLTRFGRLQVGVQCLHMRTDSIGITYNSAIGHSYLDLAHAYGMAKTKRSFLERATEALKERYPKEKATQQRLAALAGVKQPSVNDWHTGAPAMDTGVRLAENLDVCVEWLYTERGPKKPPRPTQEEVQQLLKGLDENQLQQVLRFADFIKGPEDRPE